MTALNDGVIPGAGGAPESPEELEWLRQHDAERDALHAADTVRRQATHDAATAERQAAHDFDMARLEAEHKIEIERLELDIAGLHIALDTRTAIGMAMGILMAQGARAKTPDEAFDMLRRASQRTNRKLNDIAAEIVAKHVERFASS